MNRTCRHALMSYGFFLLSVGAGGCLSLLTSCTGSQQTVASTENKEIKQTKLETLMQLPADSVMDFYDLSGDSIARMPNLSGYTIKSVDLSANQLDTLIVNFLPKGLERLNLSHNRCTYINIERGDAPSLKTLDVSFNLLKSFRVEEVLSTIIASHNDLQTLKFAQGHIQRLDISYNPHLPADVDFIPALIDTLVREGTADGKPLVNKELVFED